MFALINRGPRLFGIGANQRRQYIYTQATVSLILHRISVNVFFICLLSRLLFSLFCCPFLFLLALSVYFVFGFAA